MKPKIYLDNNATTQVDPRVVEAMMQELSHEPSNPSSIHQFGREANRRLTAARDLIAAYFKVDPSELIFTSSGTEALNLAILGLNLKGHIITSAIEHPAVYNTIQKLGLTTTYLPVDARGHVDLTDLEKAIRPDTSMIVLSAVNSETGVKNPIEAIAAIAKDRNIPLIVDAVASLAKEPTTIFDGITALTFSGHKIHGPKGIGLLYLQKKTKLTPLFSGGGQESLRRPGTENLPGIIGLAKAIEIIDEGAFTRMQTLRDYFEEKAPGSPNGTGPRICNTSSITFNGVDGEALLIQLDQNGIAASMGSACTSGALEPSRVLLNMGLSKKEALSTIRFSLSRFTTRNEIDQVLKILTPSFV